MRDLLDDERYLSGVEGETNVYKDILDSLLKKSTTSSIRNLMQNLPAFSTSRIPLEEINKTLIAATEAVVYKLYQHDVGEYSLRKIIERPLIVGSMDPIAANNVAYGVVSSVSKYTLAALLFYFDRDFIFFYIRDRIVEIHYREFIDKIKKVYERPTMEDETLTKSLRLKELMVETLSNVLVDASDSSFENINKNKEEIQRITESLDSGIMDTLLRDMPYPVPKFLEQVMKGDVEDIDRANMTEFLTELRKTFTLTGLRTIYKQYGQLNVFGSDFEVALKKLHTDRMMNNGLIHAIDRLTLEENKIMHKLVVFEPINDTEKKIVDINPILNKIRLSLKECSSVGTKCLVDNDKLTIVTGDKTEVFNYLSDTFAKDKESPFNIFGKDRDRMESIYNREPEKFCANQTIITRKEQKDAIISGKNVGEFRTQGEKIAHRNKLFRSLYFSSMVQKDRALKEEIDNLRLGGFNKVKYVSPSWFKPQTMSNSRTAVLAIAEMEGIINKIKSYNIKQNENNNN